MIDIADTNAGAALFPFLDTFTPTGTRYSMGTGALELAGDIDRWKIHLTVGDKLTVMAHLTDGPYNNDDEITLLAPNGTTVLVNNDDETGGLVDALLNYSVLSTG